tara:strand:- start:9164 stop:9568 length:405 start_codon:yes stop_codon:yes gene_type:complete
MATTSLPKLKKKLDKVFSLYIRMKHADDNGNVKCFTCESVKNWKEIQAGHFQSRRFMNTRWSEVNVKPQCVKCNMFNQGEQYRFAQRLDMIHGPNTAIVQEQLARKNSTLKRPDIIYLIEYYNNKLKQLLTHDS